MIPKRGANSGANFLAKCDPSTYKFGLMLSLVVDGVIDIYLNEVLDIVTIAGDELVDTGVNRVNTVMNCDANSNSLIINLSGGGTNIERLRYQVSKRFTVR